MTRPQHCRAGNSPERKYNGLLPLRVGPSAVACMFITAYQHGIRTAYLLVPCKYRGLETEQDRMRRCTKCCEVFCSLCSVPDYQQHDINYFCFECKMAT